ncbi:protein NUCLEAR FUSION DEFECTIVE 6, mitochondrial-like [Triticum aestivum]|uniref:Uncharacterized protein n=2 Tax=Triticinae TaxID=1648030 RepID=A0A3B6Q8V9_WHEAT|nr:protein NUCLEAR FUSION DEFECTIVE 6, mitochondrial-like [Aegilops tauschii subsp. strangulata]XP_044416174.1 protein NUCLEAR FUSION DEFECTIVE 6, mitochondrial-like [Triticum aestivum]
MAAAARSLLRSSVYILHATPATPSSLSLGVRPSVRHALAAPLRIVRLPVEASVCLESLLPLHSATGAARIKSKLDAGPGQGLGWLIEDN